MKQEDELSQTMLFQCIFLELPFWPRFTYLICSGKTALHLLLKEFNESAFWPYLELFEAKTVLKYLKTWSQKWTVEAPGGKNPAN